MSADRERRLALGLRKNQGRLRMATFIAEVAEALGRAENTIQVTDLETHDRLQSTAALQKERGPVFERSWPAEQVAEVKRVIDALKQQVPDELMFLFRGISDYCGAVETSSAEVLDRAFYLVGFDLEDLSAKNGQGTSGIYLLYGTYLAPSSNPSRLSKEPGYRLQVWGDSWVNVIQGAIPSPRAQTK